MELHMGQMIGFQRPDGGTTQGYFADAGAGAPSLVLIQEWWGLNDHIKDLVDRMAAAGISTLAPDLYRGRLAKDGDEASHMMNTLDFADATHQDLRGAVAHLAARGQPVGVMGFCMGGALTVASAVHVPGVAAAVCFYGVPPAAFADPAHIRIPFQGHFATKDDWCTPAVVGQLEAAMTGAGQHPEIHFYEAQHAFVNRTRPEVYDAACATLAWDRSVAFLRQHLARA
jgi:carboxymethylenebutenolidase